MFLWKVNLNLVTMEIGIIGVISVQSETLQILLFLSSSWICNRRLSAHRFAPCKNVYRNLFFRHIFAKRCKKEFFVLSEVNCYLAAHRFLNATTRHVGYVCMNNILFFHHKLILFLGKINLILVAIETGIIHVILSPTCGNSCCFVIYWSLDCSLLTHRIKALQIINNE